MSMLLKKREKKGAAHGVATTTDNKNLTVLGEDGGPW
jgi:hypothetical protein